MSVNIENPETHELAERVARLTGETLTAAVTTALRERLTRLEQAEGSDEAEARYRALKALVKGSRQLWSEPNPSIEHGDLLYDERGLPK